MVALALVTFTAALFTSIATIALMVGPQWRRIVRLASGHVELSFAPLQALVQAERRIAVKRWASAGSVPIRLRAAA